MTENVGWTVMGTESKMIVILSVKSGKIKMHFNGVKDEKVRLLYSFLVYAPAIQALLLNNTVSIKIESEYVQKVLDLYDVSPFLDPKISYPSPSQEEVWKEQLDYLQRTINLTIISKNKLESLKREFFMTTYSALVYGVYVGGEMIKNGLK